MKLFSFFDTSSEKKFAAELAENLIKNIPAKSMSDSRQVLSANRITRILEQMLDRARKKNESLRWGFIKRTVLVNNFKWELRTAGYPTDFIDLAVESLIVELTKNPKSSRI